MPVVLHSFASPLPSQWDCRGANPDVELEESAILLSKGREPAQKAGALSRATRASGVAEAAPKPLRNALCFATKKPQPALRLRADRARSEELPGKAASTSCYH